MPDLYLASQSPRRRELLTQIGVDFSVLSVDVPEERQINETPLAYVKRLAIAKSQAGSAIQTSVPVLGSDTIVTLGEQVLEKPDSESQAIEMLLTLSGKTHQVITAVAISLDKRIEHCCCISHVSFAEISQAQARDYWQTGEPKDKAGAYGIQGLGAVFVKQLQGSYTNVVGLPLYETSQLLQSFNIPIWTSQK